MCIHLSKKTIKFQLSHPVLTWRIAAPKQSTLLNLMNIFMFIQCASCPKLKSHHEETWRLSRCLKKLLNKITWFFYRIKKDLKGSAYLNKMTAWFNPNKDKRNYLSLEALKILTFKKKMYWLEQRGRDLKLTSRLKTYL
jgi:hypothetical protein